MTGRCHSLPWAPPRREVSGAEPPRPAHGPSLDREDGRAGCGRQVHFVLLGDLGGTPSEEVNRGERHPCPPFLSMFPSMFSSSPGPSL